MKYSHYYFTKELYNLTVVSTIYLISYALDRSIHFCAMLLYISILLNDKILSAKSRSSPFSNKSPAPDTIFDNPGTFEAITGLPAAMPSTAANPKPSQLED